MSLANMNPIIAREIKRKGGRRRVKKGFAMNPDLAREAGRKGGIAKRDNRKNNTQKKIVHTSEDNTPNLADILGNLDG